MIVKDRYAGKMQRAMMQGTVGTPAFRTQTGPRYLSFPPSFHLCWYDVCVGIQELLLAYLIARCAGVLVYGHRKGRLCPPFLPALSVFAVAEAILVFAVAEVIISFCSDGGYPLL